MQYNHYTVHLKGKNIDLSSVNIIIAYGPLEKKTILPLTPKILIFFKRENDNYTFVVNKNLCLGVK